MPGSVKSQADERKWDRAKRIIRKQYGGIESKGKWPAAQAVYQNIKKHASAEEIFWAAFEDELEKDAQIGHTGRELAKKLLGAYRAGKATATQQRVLKNMARASRSGMKLDEFARRYVGAPGMAKVGHAKEAAISESIRRGIKYLTASARKKALAEKAARRAASMRRVAGDVKKLAPAYLDQTMQAFAGGARGSRANPALRKYVELTQKAAKREALAKRLRGS